MTLPPPLRGALPPGQGIATIPKKTRQDPPARSGTAVRRFADPCAPMAGDADLGLRPCCSDLVVARQRLCRAGQNCYVTGQ